VVKIFNQAGDFKRGRQGDAVYQGHYGRQIRRLFSPRDCEPTKPQLAQRTRFEQALSWRETLSKDEKTFLEGYSIHHGIRNKDGVTLTWDRLAIKLAIEKPVVLIKEV
jgi:hypothetical protein